MRRFLPVIVAVAAGLLRFLLPEQGGAFSLLGAVLCSAGALTLMGLGLLRMVGWRGPESALWPASLSTGMATAVVLSSLPLAVGLGSAAQSMALVVGLLGLGAAAVLTPVHLERPVIGERGKHAARTVEILPALVPLIGVVAAWLPLMIGGAWSVAGHDLDTLQHQDGALHAIMTILSGEGVRTAPGYPLGLHAFMSAQATVLGVSAFQSFSITVILLVGVAAAGAVWAAASLGGGPTIAGIAGLLVAVHPLLLFTSMEQFAPQLVAAALIPAVLAACLDDTALDHAAAQAILPAMGLAAILSAYGLAVGVAGPVALAALMRPQPFRVLTRRVAFVVLLSVVLAPLGMFRLVERLQGTSSAASPVKAAARVKDTTPDPGDVIAPDVERLGEAREATSALRWELTAAHVVGVSPYRDHFLRTARMVSTSLGRKYADVINLPLSLWASAMVPLSTVILGLLALLAVVMRAQQRLKRGGLALAVVVPVVIAALWLGAGSGIKPYYGFKFGSLSLGLLMVAVALGVQDVAEWSALKFGRILVLLALVTRLPAFMAVEGEYARDLALDAEFTRVIAPAITLSRARAAAASDNSPTRRYWESRLLFARARETRDPWSADVLLCVRGQECPLEGYGRLVVRSGAFTLWARR